MYKRRILCKLESCELVDDALNWRWPRGSLARSDAPLREMGYSRIAIQADERVMFGTDRMSLIYDLSLTIKIRDQNIAWHALLVWVRLYLDYSIRLKHPAKWNKDHSTRPAPSRIKLKMNSMEHSKTLASPEQGDIPLSNLELIYVDLYKPDQLWSHLWSYLWISRTKWKKQGYCNSYKTRPKFQKNTRIHHPTTNDTA